MKAKSLLLTSVAGAVVVGGALTGVTVASFSGSAPLPADKVHAGSLSLGLGPTTGSVGSLTLGGRGEAVVTLLERGEGKHLETRRVVDDVRVVGLPSEAVQVEFRERRPNDRSACESNGFVDWAQASRVPGQRRQLALGSRGRPSPTSEVCVRVTLLDSAKSLISPGTATGSVLVTFASQQVQGEQVAGWQASTDRVDIPFAVTVPPAAPQSAECSISGASTHDAQLALTWPSQPGVDDYVVTRIWKNKPAKELAGAVTEQGARTTWSAMLASILTADDYAEYGKPGGDLGNQLQVVALADGIPSTTATFTILPVQRNGSWNVICR